MNKESIKAFLQYGKRPIDKGWLTTALVINIIAFAVGVFFSENKIINGCICGTFCIGLVAFYFKSILNKKMTEDLLNLYYGIYMTFLCISLNYVACILLCKVLGHPVIIIFILLTLTIAVGVITFIIVCLGIKTGIYIQKKEKPISAAIIAGGVGIFTMFYYTQKNYFNTEHYFLLFGVLIGLLAVLMASNIWFIIKYYFYRELKMQSEKERLEDV